ASPAWCARDRLDDGVLGPAPKGAGEGLDDLADGGVGAYRGEDRRHQIDVGLRGVGCDGRKRSGDGTVVTLSLHVGQPLELALLDLGPDVESVEWRVIGLGEAVDADDDPASGVDLPLELIRGLGD